MTEQIFVLFELLWSGTEKSYRTISRFVREGVTRESNDTLVIGLREYRVGEIVTCTSRGRIVPTRGERRPQGHDPIEIRVKKWRCYPAHDLAITAEPCVSTVKYDGEWTIVRFQDAVRRYATYTGSSVACFDNDGEHPRGFFLISEEAYGDRDH